MPYPDCADPLITPEFVAENLGAIAVGRAHHLAAISAIVGVPVIHLVGAHGGGTPGSIRAYHLALGQYLDPLVQESYRTLVRLNNLINHGRRGIP